MSAANAGARFKVRIRVIAAFFIAAALICVGRLYYLQIMQGAAYAAKADHEFITPQGDLFDRGTIYFSNKDGAEIAAATNERGASLAIEPPKLENPEAAFAALSKIVPLDHADFENKLHRPGAQYAVLLDHLATSTGAALEALSLPGVVVAQDAWRYYPGNSLAAQTIGFVGYNGDALEGRYGLERQYEKVLERQSESLYANFFVELFAGAKTLLSGQNEGDVITTIDPAVQAELERQLQVYEGEWHPQSAGGIIMDPATGAIYAMADYPSFDLNNFSSQKDPSIFNNALVQNVYEMGSIVKPLTMAAGIDAGAVEHDTTYDDTGCITVNTAKVCNYDFKARGVIPMQQVLSQSLNVGASFVATQLGPDRMRDYFLNHYELGDKTGIDLPSEASGLVSNLKSPRQLEYDEASFGQGIALTPMETVRALAVLANGGYLVTPHIGRAILSNTGIEVPLSYPKTQVLAASSTNVVSQMLTEVVDTALVNGKDKLDHWSVAAKTGTAQIANPQTGGYYTNTYLHSFFGYFPSYNGRFIIFLYAFEPKGALYASETWAAIFHELTQYLINYYQVPPDR